MRRTMKCLLPLLLLPAALPAQGVSADWDVSKSVAALSAQAARLKPILDQLTPQEWVAKGAPQTYVRLQSLENRLHSLADGVRKYQNPAVGDLLLGVLAENSSNRDNLRQYITDLAAQKEQEFQIVDKEAQRCRGILSRQPPPKKQ